MREIPTNKTVVILEPDGRGHKLYHPRRIARELVSRGVHVSLATQPDAEEHPVVKSLKNELGKSFSVFYLPPPCSTTNIFMQGKRWFYKQFGYYLWFKTALENIVLGADPSYVFIPYLDYCMYALGWFPNLFRNIAWSGMVMSLGLGYREMGIPVFSYNKTEVLKNVSFIRLLKKKLPRTLFTIQSPCSEFIKRRYPSLAHRFRYVPDPIEEMQRYPLEIARRHLNLPQEHSLILLFGEISLRKGVGALVESMRSHFFPQDAIVILAGRQIEDGRSFMKQAWVQELVRKKRIIEINRFIKDDEQALLFSAVDLAWAGYKRFYLSSGVLLLSAFAGLPVVGSPEGLVGWTIQNEGLGKCVNIDDPEAVAKSIRGIFEDKAFTKACKDNGKRLAENHYERFFIEPIVNEIIGGILR